MTDLPNKVVVLQTSDGELIDLPPELLELSTTCKNLLRSKGKKSSFQNSLGGTFSIEDNHVILKKEGRVLATLVKDSPSEAQILLHDVKAGTLRKVLEYCWYDINPGDQSGDKDRRAWKSNFVNVEQSQLCDLASASYYLDIKTLVNITSRAIATQVSGKSTEELRETFYNIGNDAFSSNITIRSRLQKKMNQKKQQQEKKTVVQSTADNRSLDELLQFIENNDKKSSGKAAKPTQQSAQPSKAQQSSKSTLDGKDRLRKEADSYLLKDPSTTEALRWLEEADPDDEAFWTAQEDQELGRDAREALDREVEMFRQRLEADSQTSVRHLVISPCSSSFSDLEELIPVQPTTKIRIPMKPSDFMKKMSWVDVC